MKKLILITAMFMATTIWADIEIVEEKEGLTVYCISDHIVIKNQSGGMIQLMQFRGNKAAPMLCRNYK